MKKIFYLITLNLLFINAALAEPLLVFAKIINTPDQQVGAQILKAAYKKISIDIKFSNMPGKRALKESSEGRLDGEVHRIYAIAKAYPSLIRVPTPINYIESSVFTKNIKIEVDDCTALKGYTIGIVGGVKHAELCTKGLPNVEVFGYSTEMMKLLDHEKIDIAITAKVNGLILAKK